MRETERRINEYRERLPHLKAKVMSIAFMFAVSIIMMTAASFAWVTLSANPEITGITTTVTANGNLEIALSDTDGLEPDESKIGDGNLELTKRNLTWGNLVNLSDLSYGLDEIVLRPAALNISSLLNSPLYAAVYGGDGRVETLSSEFSYSNYNKGNQAFEVPKNGTQYGVRAISSVTYSAEGQKKIFYEALVDTNQKLSTAQNTYLGLTGNSDNMSAISKILGVYLSDKLNDTDSDFQEYVGTMHTILSQFEQCMNETGQAILGIAYLQGLAAGKLEEQNLASGQTVYIAKYTDIEELLNATTTDLKNNGVSIPGLTQYKTDYENCKKHMAALTEIKADVDANGSEVLWDNKLAPIVNYLVDVATSEVNGVPVGTLSTSDIDALLANTDYKAVIKKGALYNMELRLGVHMYAEDLPVKVTYKFIPVTIKADVYTNASVDAAKITDAYYLPKAIDTVKNSSDNFKGTQLVAADTYGMAIDFWIRSNAETDYVTLEGTTLTRQVQKTDEQGNLYFTHSTTKEVIIQRSDQKYYYENGEQYTGETTDLTVTWDTEVTGFEGENRVWDDNYLNEYSATQGSGSCYTFYADTPQDQAQSLEVLSAMTVVFVDDSGNLLAYADMDTASYYAENGRVIVPLKLRSTSDSVGTDANGNTIYTITALERGVAKRITALIYIDGTRLENADVLADGNIQGQLNIQFGSASTMEPIEDSAIYEDEIHISATVSKDTFETTDTDYTTTVTLKVEGISPDVITANFIRQINSTQGSRQESITFDENLQAIMTFKSAGTYVLRTVWLDGIEYRLDSPVTVTIPGLSIADVAWDYDPASYKKIMSAGSSHSETITVTLSGTTTQPQKVQGIFSNENNQQVTVNFKRGSADWSGTAQFNTSGIYHLRYLLIDGEYYEIPSADQKTLELALGMKATVQISKTSFKYEGETVVLKVFATIMDNTGVKLTGLSNVSLQYMSQSSTLIENGLYTSLTWNADTEKYEGTFNVNSAGAYEFGYLTLAGSSITQATAPVIQAIPPEPPSYFDNGTAAEIFAFESEVAFRIGVMNSPVTLAAILEKDGQQFEVKGTRTSFYRGENYEQIEDVNYNLVADWLFEIPKEGTEVDYPEDEGLTLTSQEGTWKLVGLKASGCYDANEKYYYYNDGSNSEDTTKTEWMDMTVPGGSNTVTTEITEDMTVIVTGTGKSDLTSQFLSGVTVDSGFMVQVVGGTQKKPALGINDGTKDGTTAPIATFKLNTSVTTSTGATSVGYGSTAVLEKNSEVSVELVPDPSDKTGSTFILNTDDPLTLVLQGDYTLYSITYEIGDKQFGVTTANKAVAGRTQVGFSGDVTAYKLTWTAPVVKVTKISPSGNVTVNTGGGTWGAAKSGTVENKIIDAYTCTVHLIATIKYSSISDYECSTVETTISEVGSFSSASLTVYGSDSDVTYDYTASALSSVRDIGEYWEIARNWKRNLLGNGAQGTHITVTGTYNDTTFTYVYKLANPITINNPY